MTENANIYMLGQDLIGYLKRAGKGESNSEKGSRYARLRFDSGKGLEKDKGTVKREGK